MSASIGASWNDAPAGTAVGAVVGAAAGAVVGAAAGAFVAVGAAGAVVAVGMAGGLVATGGTAVGGTVVGVGAAPQAERMTPAAAAAEPIKNCRRFKSSSFLARFSPLYARDDVSTHRPTKRISGSDNLSF